MIMNFLMRFGRKTLLVCAGACMVANAMAQDARFTPARRYGVANEVAPDLDAPHPVTFFRPEASSIAEVLDELCRFTGCQVQEVAGGYRFSP